MSRRSVFSLKTLKNVPIFIFLELTAKQICENFLADLSKVYLYCPKKNVLRKTSCFGTLFFCFWDFECKFHALWQNKLSEGVKTSFYVSWRSFFFRWKLSKMPECLVFSYLQLKEVCENFLADLSKVYLSCPQ